MGSPVLQCGQEGWAGAVVVGAGEQTRRGLTRMFHEADFAGSFLFRGLYFVDLARV